MKKRGLYILVVSLMLSAVLMACSNNTSEQGVEMQTGEYSINRTTVNNSDSTDADYEIDDMLPRPSDDTLIMSVEDALELTN